MEFIAYTDYGYLRYNSIPWQILGMYADVDYGLLNDSKIKANIKRIDSLIRWWCRSRVMIADNADGTVDGGFITGVGNSKHGSLSADRKNCGL